MDVTLGVKWRGPCIGLLLRSPAAQRGRSSGLAGGGFLQVGSDFSVSGCHKF